MENYKGHLKVPVEDKQYSLAILLELAIQHANLHNILEAIMLLIRLWKSQTNIDNKYVILFNYIVDFMFISFYITIMYFVQLNVMFEQYFVLEKEKAILKNLLICKTKTIVIFTCVGFPVQIFFLLLLC